MAILDFLQQQPQQPQQSIGFGFGGQQQPSNFLQAPPIQTTQQQTYSGLFGNPQGGATNNPLSFGVQQPQQTTGFEFLQQQPQQNTYGANIDSSFTGLDQFGNSAMDFGGNNPNFQPQQPQVQQPTGLFGSNISGADALNFGAGLLSAYGGYRAADRQLDLGEDTLALATKKYDRYISDQDKLAANNARLYTGG